MARIRSTARLTNEGENTEETETVPISEVMRRSGLVVQEGEEVIPEKDDAITEAASDDDEDDGILSQANLATLDLENPS
jgi:hypothetical protein